MEKDILNAREERVNLMEGSNIKKALVTLTIPSIIATLISAIYNLVDTLFVGKLNDTASIGAVSVTFPLFMVIAALGQMIGVGAASYISRSLGEKKNDRASKTASTATFISVVFSILTVIITLPLLNKILLIMGTSENVLPLAKSYSVYLILGSIFTITNMNLNNIIRAEGNSKFSMNTLIIGAVINIILDPIFIFTLNLGVKGAAIATVIGQAVSTVYLISYFKRGKSFLNLSVKNISNEKDIYLEIFKIGVPVFLMQFLSSMVFTIQNAIAAPYGDEAIAAIGITLRVYIIPSYIILGYIQGFQPFLGYNYGAKKYDRVKEALKTSIVWLTAFLSLCFLVMNVFSKEIVSTFSKDRSVIELSVNNLRALLLLLPTLGFSMIYSALFQALGKGRQASILAIGRQGLFYIPLLILLPKFFQVNINKLGIITNCFSYKMPAGLYGLMLAQPLSDIISFIITLILAIMISKELKGDIAK